MMIRFQKRWNELMDNEFCLVKQVNRVDELNRNEVLGEEGQHIEVYGNIV